MGLGIPAHGYDGGKDGSREGDAGDCGECVGDDGEESGSSEAAGGERRGNDQVRPLDTQNQCQYTYLGERVPTLFSRHPIS